MHSNGFKSNWLALSARRSQLWIKSSRYTTVCYPVYNPHISYEPFSTFNRGSQRFNREKLQRLDYTEVILTVPCPVAILRWNQRFFWRPIEREIPCWDHRETIILWRRPGSRELSLLFTTPKLETENRICSINKNPCLCSNNINITKGITASALRLTLSWSLKCWNFESWFPRSTCLSASLLEPGIGLYISNW